MPLDSGALAELGAYPALVYHYLKAGWLERLGRGVFMFPNDTLRQEDCLKFFARRVPNFHVGGKTALAWRGILHNLPARAPLSLWGERLRLPAWFRERFPSRYTTRHPFGPKLPKEFGLQPLPDAPNGVPISVPERALLEMLSEVGGHQGLEEARNIMEGSRSLRPEVLGTLLKHCERVKVTRLCVQWAEELDLPWASSARKAVAKKWGQSRWVCRLRDGKVLILKP